MVTVSYGLNLNFNLLQARLIISDLIGEFPAINLLQLITYTM